MLNWFNHHSIPNDIIMKQSIKMWLFWFVLRSFNSKIPARIIDREITLTSEGQLMITTRLYLIIIHQTTTTTKQEKPLKNKLSDHNNHKSRFNSSYKFSNSTKRILVSVAFCWFTSLQKKSHHEQINIVREEFLFFFFLLLFFSSRNSS